MISREEALKLLQKNVKAENMLKHSYASEAVLRALANRLNQNAEEWGIAGLLHDVDVEITNADPKTHGPYAANILEGLITDNMLDAIVMLLHTNASIQVTNVRFLNGIASVQAANVRFLNGIASIQDTNVTVLNGIVRVQFKIATL